MHRPVSLSFAFLYFLGILSRNAQRLGCFSEASDKTRSRDSVPLNTIQNSAAARCHARYDSTRLLANPPSFQRRATTRRSRNVKFLVVSTILIKAALFQRDRLSNYMEFPRGMVIISIVRNLERN